MNKKKQVHLYIKGDVIGVGFRAWTKIQAKIFNIDGWVKNTHNNPHLFGPQGGVEVVMQGDVGQLEKVVEVIKRGSPVSRVDDCEIFWQEPREIFQGFEIRR